MTKRNAIIFSVIFALLYSISYAVIGPMIKSQVIVFDSSRILPYIICFVICAVLNFFVFTFFTKIRFKKADEWMQKRLEKVKDIKLFLILWAVFFVAWIPAFLILFPGVLSYDFISQSGSALTVITSNHHPVLHTWTIRVFMNLGYNLFKSYEVGIGLLSLLQMILLSYALAKSVMLIKAKKVPLPIVAVVAFLSAFWFLNPVLAVTMVKDTLHTAFLIIFACHYAEIVTDPKAYVKKKRNYILFPIVTFFMCAYRNNGFHIYVFCFAFLLLFRIAKIKKIKSYIGLIVMIILSAVVFKIYSGPVIESLGIEQGEIREALSIPIQQMQRVAILHGAELTEEQNDLMNYYITDLSWRDWDPGRKYDPFISDPAKSCFYSGAYNENPAAFWTFYAKTGKQFTKEYVVAFLSNTSGFWYPGMYQYSFAVYDNYEPEAFPVYLERKSILNSNAVKGFYESLCEGDFWRKAPVLRFFFVPGYTLWILLYVIVLSWKKKGYFKNVFPLHLPLIAQFGIMILSPMSSFRYSWPFYLLLPVSLIGIYMQDSALKEDGAPEEDNAPGADSTPGENSIPVAADDTPKGE